METLLRGWKVDEKSAGYLQRLHAWNVGWKTTGLMGMRDVPTAMIG
jgi:hypothetical protein